jgi:hypothetical protein
MPTVKIMGRDYTFELEPAVESAEETAFQTNLAEGWGDPREIAAAQRDAQLAAEVQAMSVAEYGRNRARLGTAGPDTISFLGGS